MARNTLVSEWRRCLLLGNCWENYWKHSWVPCRKRTQALSYPNWERRCRKFVFMLVCLFTLSLYKMSPMPPPWHNVKSQLTTRPSHFLMQSLHYSLSLPFESTLHTQWCSPSLLLQCQGQPYNNCHKSCYLIQSLVATQISINNVTSTDLWPKQPCSQDFASSPSSLPSPPHPFQWKETKRGRRKLPRNILRTRL